MALSVAVDDIYRGRFASRARRNQKHHQDGEGLANIVGGQLQGRGHAHDVPGIGAWATEETVRRTKSRSANDRPGGGGHIFGQMGHVSWRDKRSRLTKHRCGWGVRTHLEERSVKRPAITRVPKSVGLQV